jgi:hypothetical protein
MAAKESGFSFTGTKVASIPTATRANRTSKYDQAWDSAIAGGVVQFGPYPANVAGALRQRLLNLAEKNKVNLKVVTRPGDDGERIVFAELVEEAAK